MTDKKKSSQSKKKLPKIDNTLSFEEALSQLEQIISSLEDSSMSLDDAIKAYEKGAQLRAYCEKKLEKAQLKVRAIIEKSDNRVELKTME